MGPDFAVPVALPAEPAAPPPVEGSASVAAAVVVSERVIAADLFRAGIED